MLEMMIHQSEELNLVGIKDFPNLNAYVERFQQLEKVKAFREKSSFMHRPFNNYIAQWK